MNRGTSQASKSPGYHKPITMTKKPQRQQQCGNCGYKHKTDICPGKGKKCDNCKKWNNFAKMCRSGVSNKKSQVKNVYEVYTQPEHTDPDSDFFH